MSDENMELPEVLQPTAHQSLQSAKMFLIRSVEGLLTAQKWDHAKMIVDTLARVEQVLADRQIANPPSRVDTRFAQNEIDAILAGRKIDAIKLVRQRTSLGLKEAKDLVESFRPQS